MAIALQSWGTPDDILVLKAPTVSVLKNILKMCETFVKKRNLHISANQNPTKEKVNASGSAPISKTKKD